MNNIDTLANTVSAALFEAKIIPTVDQLKNIVKGHAALLATYPDKPSFTDADIEQALTILQTRHDISMGFGVLFDTEDFQPWLADRRGDIEFYYWNRYYALLKQKYAVDVVKKLDSITDKILDHLEDPQKNGIWERKGLVVGNVQSGKTANYIGLITKAADAGYKVIIILGGMMNSLRNQTQERIDSDFLGYCTRKQQEFGVSNFGNKRRPISLTTSVRDFTKATADSVQIDLNALLEPVILVLKKNVTTLENVRKWLSSGNQRGLSEIPLLLIDDEADNASINTNKGNQDPTKINQGIRKLLQMFPRNSYVGYTATPFANIFIDPEMKMK